MTLKPPPWSVENVKFFGKCLKSWIYCSFQFKSDSFSLSFKKKCPIFVLIYVDSRQFFRNFNSWRLKNDILICVLKMKQSKEIFPERTWSFRSQIAQNHLKNVKFLADNERIDLKNQKLHLETPPFRAKIDQISGFFWKNSKYRLCSRLQAYKHLSRTSCLTLMFMNMVWSSNLKEKKYFFEDFSTPKFFEFFSIFFAKIWLKFDVSDSPNQVFQVFWASNVSK